MQEMIIFYMLIKKTGIGHVIVAEKIDGKLNLDAQRGIPIDNLDFTKVDDVKL